MGVCNPQTPHWLEIGVLSMMLRDSERRDILVSDTRRYISNTHTYIFTKYHN